ncbi:hypothetical protein [Actinoplanes rectilineatus]|uniref:hypothetical protein n=1 Tax=Actinoplanes rectilineatus TaxID=113571 RepID=UPI0012FC499F|nr:hypothetical protein [Actinoplanes rectilineatus]
MRPPTARPGVTSKPVSAAAYRPAGLAFLTGVLGDPALAGGQGWWAACNAASPSGVPISSRESGTSR